jgi:hypothetical protein
MSLDIFAHTNRTIKIWFCHMLKLCLNVLRRILDQLVGKKLLKLAVSSSFILLRPNTTIKTLWKPLSFR